MREGARRESAGFGHFSRRKRLLDGSLSTQNGGEGVVTHGATWRLQQGRAEVGVEAGPRRIAGQRVRPQQAA